jgi:hypothetical protein
MSGNERYLTDLARLPKHPYKVDLYRQDFLL